MAELTTNSRRQGEEASPVELLFDLVFVFAFIQLSHHMSGHLGWRSAAETVVLSKVEELSSC